MSKFQIITLALFVVFIVGGVIAFATYKGGSSSTQLPSITVWGTFPADTFNAYVNKVNNDLPQPMQIKYTQYQPDHFSNAFVAALARGQGPDAILIPAELILPHEDKLFLIPYSALPQRDFLNAYVDEGSIYLNQSGVLALPFTIDPLVMYWNRDMFNAAGVAQPPAYWDQFADLNQKLTVKDQNGTVRKTALALGTFSNVTNAREIFGALLMQIGNPVTAMTADGFVQSTVKVGNNVDPTPAVQFFTQFVDPNNANYSWNNGMPNDKSAFLSAIDATYLGFASELKDIRTKNPNLNFDVSPLPQARSQSGAKNYLKATYGRMYGLSIVRTTPYANSVYQMISTLTAPAYLSQLSQAMYLPPVRRDLIAQGSTDPYISIFDQAALVSRTWLDVDPAQSRQILSGMIQSVTSGQSQVYQALQDASAQYDVLLQKAVQ